MSSLTMRIHEMATKILRWGRGATFMASALAVAASTFPISHGHLFKSGASASLEVAPNGILLPADDGLLDASGTYKDSYGITFTLFQDGAQVWGTRPVSSSISEAITATISGNVVTGSFHNSDGGTGNFKWTFASDASSYSGLWASGTGTPSTAWNGTKQAGVSVQVTPATAVIAMGGPQAFRGYVAGSLDKNLTFSVTGGGSIDQAGNYTAPATSCRATITVTPEADTTKAVTAQVEVTTDGILDISGTYKDSYGITFTLFQDGARVWGTRPVSSSISEAITATISGNVLTGTFQNSDGNTGNFRWTFAPDASSYSGLWASGTATPTTAWNGTRQPGVSVQVSPSFGVVACGGQRTIQAWVAGSLDKTLTYSVTGGGSIDQTGLFTAPASPCQAVITATPAADGTKAVTSRIEVTNDGILDISGTFSGGYPSQVVIYQQGTSITAFGNDGRTWTGTLNGLNAVGTEDNGTYFNITFAVGGSSFTGRVNMVGSSTSPSSWHDASGTRQAGVISVWLNPAFQVAKVGTAAQFHALVAGTLDKTLTYACSGGGTIAQDGTYQAPSGPCLATVTATPAADAAKGSTAKVQVTLDGLLDVSGAFMGAPAHLAIVQAGTALKVLVAGAPTWNGTLVGLHATGSETNGTYFDITFSQDGNTFSGRYNMTQPTSPGSWSTASGTRAFYLDPPRAALSTGGTQLLTPIFPSGAAQALIWTVQEGASGGSVDSGGTYAAPATQGVFHVSAALASDSAAEALAVFTVTTPHPPTLSIAPSQATMDKGATQAFAAVVQNASNPAVTWSCSGGTIDQQGNYTAPNLFGTYTVTAALTADSTIRDTATVVVPGGSASGAFTYDANGNMTSDGQRTFAWDAENRLVSVTMLATGHVSQFVYDEFGRRVEIAEQDGGMTTNDTKYLWDDGEIIESLSPTGDTILQRYFEQGFVDGDGTALYYSFDHLGSVIELTDSAENVRARYSYDPYGRVQKVQGDRESVYQYCGYFYHAATSLSLTEYRAFDANTARWLSRDPLQENESLNLYSYVENNPLNYFDPLGLSKEEMCKKLREEIYVQWTKLIKEVAGYDPIEDGKGGHFFWKRVGPIRVPSLTKPGGHYHEIIELQKGLVRRIKEYWEKCKDKCDGPGGRPLQPGVPDDAFNKNIVPTPIYPFSFGPFPGEGAGEPAWGGGFEGGGIPVEVF